MAHPARRPIPLAAVALLTLAACSSGPSASDPKIATTESGFLRDYSRLQPSPRHPTTRYEQAASFSSYTSFIVDPVVVLPGETTRGVPIDGADAAALADALRSELSDALALRNRLASAPGPNVGRIRAAITAVARSDRSGSARATIGGAAVEAEFVDSITNKRIAAVVESDIVQDLDAGTSADPLYDARLVFRHWAGRLNLWLENPDELATQGPTGR
jgi:hypothetical protein